MSIFDSLNALDEFLPTEETVSEANTLASYNEPQEIVASADLIRNTPPQYYPNAGVFSPYTGCNWYSNAPIINELGDNGRLPALQPKLDPNRIFSPDISALRSLAADQIKAIKIFEKKFFEQMTEKGKFGCTEDDIAAMEALNSARSVVTGIYREQANIKKSIADIRIKQAQNEARANGAGSNMNGNESAVPSSAMDVGRSIMDSMIFDMGNTTPVTVVPGEYKAMDEASASNVVDDILGAAADVRVQYENDKPQTYVLVGDSDSDTEFATFDKDGNLMSDYPPPESSITTVDRSAKTATDDLLNSYPIKLKSEM